MRGSQGRGTSMARVPPAPPPGRGWWDGEVGLGPSSRGAMKLHDGEVEIDAGLVGRLVAAQFPDLAGLAVRAVRSTGTVNAIYRIGDRLCARLPRVPAAVADLDRERRWLPELAGHLSLRVPEPVAQGRPTGEYPLPWAIYGWIEGRPYADGLVDESRAARDLARFVAELRRIEVPEEAPRAGRAPSPSSTRSRGRRSRRRATASMAPGRPPPGRRRWARRRGRGRRSGSTATCYGPTSWSTVGGSRRSSTSGRRASVTRPWT